MSYAPKPFTRPKARDVQQARELYEYKLFKKYPFLTAPTGYDWDEITEYRVYGKTVQDDNKPVVRGMTHDTAYFYLHSSQVLLGQQCYTFVHLVQHTGSVIFRGLLFTDFVEAYRYANAYGCTIVKSATVDLDYLQFIMGKLDSIDMFVDINIQIADRNRRNGAR